MTVQLANYTYDSILSTIGNTPMVELGNLYPQYDANIFGKMEAFNPGGSIKDRTAYNIIIQAFEQGKLKKGDTVIESSSGNMAVGLAQTCLKYGLKLIVVVDPMINKHTLKILETYKAKIEMVNADDTAGNYLEARLKRVSELLNENDTAFWPNQYGNKANPLAHKQTMQEIITALEGRVDYLLAATSTCGTLMGCARYIDAIGLDTKIVAVDAKGSVLFGQEPASRLIPGHGAGRASQLLDTSLVDEVIHISDRESVIGCHRLLQREAILAGGSSGAVAMAAQRLLPIVPEGSNLALILCDRGERYLNTIYNYEWIEEHFGAIQYDTDQAVLYQ